MHITRGLISRRYDQGLDSIIRLVGDLEARIDDLMALHVAALQRLIQSQSEQIKRLAQTITNKDTELIEVYQLNRQLERRIRELERTLEAGDSSDPSSAVEVHRDSHNSNQPPSLDLPWIKPKRTRSLRK